MEQQEQMVPALRFPEFEGEWQRRNIGDFTKLQPGYAFSSKYFGNVGMKLVTPQNFTKFGYGNFDLKVTKFTTEDVSPIFKCTAKDLLVLLTDLTPSCELLGKPLELRKEDGEMLLNQRIVKLNTDSHKINKRFLRNFLLTKNYQKRIASTSTGTTVRHSSNRILLNTPLFLPVMEEQQKIASFLGAVDEKIAQLQKKKDLLEDYKKGCMQKLFSKELRFKDEVGQDFPDWEEKSIGGVLTIGNGKDYNHLREGDIPVYGTGGYMTSVNDYLYDGKSVCIGRKGTINKPFLLEGKFWTVDTLFYTHSFRDSVPEFIFAVFQSINWLKYNEASGVPSLSKSTIEKIKILIPHIDEQKKIADFLSALDDKIALVSEELNKAKTFKKGLLQKMFV